MGAGPRGRDPGPVEGTRRLPVSTGRAAGTREPPDAGPARPSRTSPGGGVAQRPARVRLPARPPPPGPAPPQARNRLRGPDAHGRRGSRGGRGGAAGGLLSRASPGGRLGSGLRRRTCGSATPAPAADPRADAPERGEPRSAGRCDRVPPASGGQLRRRTPAREGLRPGAGAGHRRGRGLDGAGPGEGRGAGGAGPGGGGAQQEGPRGRRPLRSSCRGDREPGLGICHHRHVPYVTRPLMSMPPAF